MRISMLLIGVALAFGSGLNAQINLVPELGGSGGDGVFAPAANTVLDSDFQSVLQYTTFTIPAGVTVTCIGSQPLTILVQGDIRIEGVLDASGQAGAASGNNQAGAVGGLGGPGGGAGGDGGCIPANPFNGAGQPGQGASPGQPGIDTTPAGTFTDPVGGGGGGGNATAGQAGGPANAGTTPSASGAGGAARLFCRAGSGGGGGGCDIDSATVATNNDGGGGGGGGGGMLRLSSNTAIIVAGTGAIFANGGRGGNSTGNGGGGGGGSGGSIELLAPVLLIDGVLNAVGGAGGLATQTNCGCSPGGAGGDGCITVRGDASASMNLSQTAPAAALAGVSSLLTQGLPVGRMIVGGVGPADTWLAALSSSLTPPGFIVGGQPFLLNIADPVFNLTFPSNSLVPLVTGLSGMGLGVITFDLSSLPVADLQLDLFVQAVQFSPVVRASNLAAFTLSF